MYQRWFGNVSVVWLGQGDEGAGHRATGLSRFFWVKWNPACPLKLLLHNGKTPGTWSSQLDYFFVLQKKSEPHWPRLDISKYNWVLAAMAKDKQAGHFFGPFFLEDLFQSTCCATCWFAWLRRQFPWVWFKKSKKLDFSRGKGEQTRRSPSVCRYVQVLVLKLHEKPWIQFTCSSSPLKLLPRWVQHTSCILQGIGRF